MGHYSSKEGTSLTSVFPMTESGPGLGGAKRQKSVTELTFLVTIVSVYVEGII